MEENGNEMVKRKEEYDGHDGTKCLYYRELPQPIIVNRNKNQRVVVAYHDNTGDIPVLDIEPIFSSTFILETLGEEALKELENKQKGTKND